MYFLLLWVSLWRLLTMAACTHCGCHNKLLPTNLWKGPTPACSVSPLPALFTCERLRRSAQPDHCDEGIFQDCLSLGLSLWDPYKSKLFHSAVPHPGCYPCWDCNPFLRGDLRSWMRSVWALAEKCPSLWVSQLQWVQEPSAHTLNRTTPLHLAGS